MYVGCIEVKIVSTNYGRRSGDGDQLFCCFSILKASCIQHQKTSKHALLKFSVGVMINISWMLF